MPNQDRLEYVAYDGVSQERSAQFKFAFDSLLAKVEGLSNSREKSLVITKLEEAFMWVGKAIRDDQNQRAAAPAAAPAEVGAAAFRVAEALFRREKDDVVRALPFWIIGTDIFIEGDWIRDVEFQVKAATKKDAHDALTAAAHEVDKAAKFTNTNARLK